MAATMRSLPLALLCLAFTSTSTANAAEASKPNIVVILADDMGYGDVRALNPKSSIPTPHLDALAAGGMTFTDAHSPSAVCTPTRYALLTGRYCWRSRLKSGVLGGYSKPLLEPGRATIASMLKAEGYHTAVFGKWHLGMDLPTRKGVDLDKPKWDGDPGIDFAGKITDGPLQHGFDECFNVSASLDMAPYVYIRNDGFTMQPTLQQKAVKFPHFVRSGPRAEDFVIDEVLDRIAEETTQFIARAAKQDEPFFVYVPFTAPHKPTQPHERFRGKTKLSEYGDFVVQVDDTVGRILKSLDEAGVADDTLVFYTSDNGSYMYAYEDDRPDHVDDAGVQGYRVEHHRANGPFRGTKADIWEAGHHVPFLVRWPGHVEPKSTCAEPIAHVDIFATCAAVAGAKLRNDAAEDSASLVPFLSGDHAHRPAPVIHHSASGMFAIRDGQWKLVAGNGSGGRQAPRGKPFAKPYQLFDMQADIAETKNVAEEHPDVVERLTKKLEEIRENGRSVER